jgi:glycerol-1-phosphate dehydrogenase [NAD(P)+]
MIAAGFADAFCKFTALADWRLGALFWGEPWEAGVAGRGLAAARSVVDAAPAISAGEAGGIEVLFAALLEFGSCMAEVGHSRPASGAEHQYSHFWEMRLLREGRPPILHGLKVGVGAVIASGWWDRIRGLSRREAAVLLGRARRPGREAESRLIEAAYGPDAPEIIGTQERFIGMDDASWAGLIEDLIGRWDEVLGLAAMVPTEAETRRLLALVGCPCEPAELGLGVAEIELARSSAHWLRDRFTVRKLGRMLFELG